MYESPDSSVLLRYRQSTLFPHSSKLLFHIPFSVIFGIKGVKQRASGISFARISKIILRKLAGKCKKRVYQRRKQYVSVRCEYSSLDCFKSTLIPMQRTHMQTVNTALIIVFGNILFRGQKHINNLHL